MVTVPVECDQKPLTQVSAGRARAPPDAGGANAEQLLRSRKPARSSQTEGGACCLT